MKKIFILSSLLLYFACNLVSGQMMSLSRFDYNLLKNKVLYIEKFSESSDYAKKLIKRGKFDKLKTLQEKIAYYNTIWTEAMAKSSYDATPYEIREFEPKILFKEKNKDAIILTYNIDQYGNISAMLWITGPKRTAIANTIITGLDLSDPNDIRIMMNMLNYSLNECAEIDATTGDKTWSGLRNKFKQNVVEFYQNLPQQVFYVIKEEDPEELKKGYETNKELIKKYKDDKEMLKIYKKEEKSPSEEKKEIEKAIEKNKEVEEALKGNWNICKYEIISESELQKKKDEGVTNGFYWKSFKYYTNNIFMTYKLRYLLTIDRDEIVFFYYGLGSASFKASSVKDLQEKIISKGEKYKKQLEKK